MTEQEVLSQCCICKYPSRTPEQLKRTSHGICHICSPVAYPEAYKAKMEKLNDPHQSNNRPSCPGIVHRAVSPASERLPERRQM